MSWKIKSWFKTMLEMLRILKTLEGWHPIPLETFNKLNCAHKSVYSYWILGEIKISEGFCLPIEKLLLNRLKLETKQRLFY